MLLFCSLCPYRRLCMLMGYNGTVGFKSCTMITSGQRLLSHSDIHSENGSLFSSAPPESQFPFLHSGFSTLSAGVREINLKGCWVLLTYQPNSILLTGTEMMALSLTIRVSEQQK